MSSETDPATEDRTKRILDEALAMAEAGGFEAVRMRDIASRASVSLATLYKRFSSKEEVLVAVLERELGALENQLAWVKVLGDTVEERSGRFFSVLTQLMCAKEKLTRAVLRAVAAGDPAMKGRVSRYHERINALIVAAMGDGKMAPGQRTMTEEEIAEVAHIFSQVWFAALVGWMGGQIDVNTVAEQIKTAAKWLLNNR